MKKQKEREKEKEKSSTSSLSRSSVKSEAKPKAPFKYENDTNWLVPDSFEVGIGYHNKIRLQCCGSSIFRGGGIRIQPYTNKLFTRFS